MAKRCFNTGFFVINGICPNLRAIIIKYEVKELMASSQPLPPFLESRVSYGSRASLYSSASAALALVSSGTSIRQGRSLSLSGKNL